MRLWSEGATVYLLLLFVIFEHVFYFFRKVFEAQTL
jgi:hypothetical protein